MKSTEEFKQEQKILVEYRRYCEAMTGKDTIKSYEEYKQLFINMIQKRKVEAAKKRREPLANSTQVYSKQNKFQVGKLKAYQEYCESTKGKDTVKSFEEFISEQKILADYEGYLEVKTGKADAMPYEQFKKVHKERQESEKRQEFGSIQSELARKKFMTTQYGPINPAMVCPQCQTTGKIRTKHITQKKGVSGGKAVAAIVTLGWSMLAVGLSRKEGATQAYCDNCNNTWVF